MNNTDDSLMEDQSESILFRLSDSIDQELCRSTFEFHFKNQMEETFNGKIIKVVRFQKIKKEKLIKTMIWFHKDADNKFIEIYQIISSKFDIRKPILNKLQFSNTLYRSKINLIIPTKVKISVLNTNFSKTEILVGNVAIALCKILFSKNNDIPKFINLHQFRIRNSKISSDGKERNIQLYIDMSDHMKNLTCIAGKTIANVTIQVSHYPTKVKLFPENIKYLINGSTIVCGHLNGYPKPIILWKFINGPLNASNCYSISGDGKKLKVIVYKITNDIWIFNCSAKNTVLGVSRTFNKTVSFVIIENQTNPIYNKNKTDQINYITINRKISILNDKVENYDKRFLNLKQTFESKMLKFQEIYESKFSNIKTIDKNQNDQIFLINQKLEEIKMEIKNAISSFRVENKYSKKMEISTNNNKKPTTHTNSNQNSYPPFNILPSHLWTIDNISNKIKKGYFQIGSYFYADYNGYRMRLYLYPKGYKNRSGSHLSVAVGILFGTDKELYKSFEGDIIIGIYNRYNENLNQIINKKCYINNKLNFEIFNFNLKDLSITGVLMNDSVIIKIFVLSNN